MKLSFGRAKSKQSIPPRRIVAAQRQAELAAEELVAAQAYRRNRILNSRHSATPVEESERTIAHLRADRRKIWRRRLLTTVASVSVIIFLLWHVALGISVQTPDVASAKENARYSQVLSDYFATRPIERLSFFTNHTSLKEFLLRRTPEIKTARLEPGGITVANLKLTFRQPVVQWTSGDKTYFVDTEGITFERNYFSSPSVIVKDESGIPAASGQEVINQRFLSFLGQAVALFREQQIVVTEVSLPPETVRQVVFRFEHKPYAVKMTVDREVGAQVQQALKAMVFMDERKLVPSYLDVRVDQRVFYQ